MVTENACFLWNAMAAAFVVIFPIAPHRGNPGDAQGMLLLQSTNPLMLITP